jgi:hypothetical protein
MFASRDPKGACSWV